jgi:ABC-type branched-subunit amino acid transport system permease subunit
VAGGLRSRSGIVVSSAVVALLDLLIRKIPGVQDALDDIEHTIPVFVIVVGAIVLLLAVRKQRWIAAGVGAALILLAAVVLSPAEVPLIEPQLHQWPGFTPGTFRLLFLPAVVVVTLVTAPGGLGQQIRPIQRWLAGHRFDLHAGHVEEVVISDVRA